MTSRPPSERAARIAENESRFREINHRLAEDVEPLLRTGERVGFVCECGHEECTGELLLSIADYEAVRADARCFAVLPGHEIVDVEDVVRHAGGYVVIRKHEPTHAIVERSDPADGA